MIKWTEFEINTISNKAQSFLPIIGWEVCYKIFILEGKNVDLATLAWTTCDSKGQVEPAWNVAIFYCCIIVTLTSTTLNSTQDTFSSHTHTHTHSMSCSLTRFSTPFWRRGYNQPRSSANTDDWPMYQCIPKRKSCSMKDPQAQQGQ